MCNGCMPFQFPISNPYPFEHNKGVGCGSLYCGLDHLNQCHSTSILWSYRFPKKYLTIFKPLNQFPHVVFVPHLFLTRLDLFDFATFVQSEVLFVRPIDLLELWSSNFWADTDTERWKLGEPMGLDTLVVLAVNLYGLFPKICA